MATNFTKNYVFYQDSDGADVTETFNYSASLDDQNASISKEVDGEYVIIKVQPFKPMGDGSRATWDDEADVVAWFKNQPDV